jgi:hypothetical protein
MHGFFSSENQAALVTLDSILQASPSGSRDSSHFFSAILQGSHASLGKPFKGTIHPTKCHTVLSAHFKHEPPKLLLLPFLGNFIHHPYLYVSDWFPQFLFKTCNTFILLVYTSFDIKNLRYRNIYKPR